MMNLIKKLFLLTLAISLFSCSKDDDSTADSTAPTFKSVLINGNDVTEADEIELMEDDSLGLTITVSDNQALSSLSIDIHEADGHDHRIRKEGEEAHEHDEEPLSFDKVINGLSGTEATIYVRVTEKLNYESGDYHIVLILLDEQSNRSEVVYEFHLEHDGDAKDGEHHDHDKHEGDKHEGEHHEDDKHEGEHHEDDKHEGEHHEDDKHEGEHHEDDKHEGEHHEDDKHEGEHHEDDKHEGEHHEDDKHEGEHHEDDKHEGEHQEGDKHEGEHHEEESLIPAKA